MKINGRIIRPIGVSRAVLAVLLWGGMSVRASDQMEAESEEIEFRVRVASEEEQTESEVVGRSERITITLDDVSLEDAVRLFTQTTGANIIATSAMTAGRRVTVNLNDVDWRPALRSILEIHDLALVERTPGSGVYTITEPHPDAPPPTLVKTFFLDYTTTSEVQGTIQSMLRPGATLTVFPSRNALVVRAQESNLVEVEQLLATLDLPARQVLIETRIVELSDSASRQLGIKWDSLEEFAVSASAGPFTWSTMGDRTRRRSESDQYWDMERRDQWDRGYRTDQTARYYDAQGREMVGGTFYDLVPGTPSYIMNPVTGIPELITPPPTYVENPVTGPFFVQDPATRTFGSERDIGLTHDRQRGRDLTWGDSYDSVRRMSEARSAVIEMDRLNIILSALARMDGVTLVSNPKMLVTSGSTNAFFSVGTREPIIQTEVVKGTPESPGDMVISRLATDINTDIIRQGFMEDGVDLRVVATVKTDDHIEAGIHPSLRRKIGEKVVEIGVAGAVNRFPILEVKDIRTSFTLRSGQTVAIGGLTQTRDDKQTTRVPILGSIPVLGRLFRHERDVKSQVETIIFVTLSVGDPDRLGREAGIPEDARLVHTRMIREQADRAEFDRQLRQMQEAQDAAMGASPVTEAEPIEEQPVITEPEPMMEQESVEEEPTMEETLIEVEPDAQPEPEPQSDSLRRPVPR